VRQPLSVNFLWRGSDGGLKVKMTYPFAMRNLNQLVKENLVVLVCNEALLLK